MFFLLLLISGYLRIRWLYPDRLTRALGCLLDEMLFEIYCYFGVAALWYLASVVCLIHSYRTAVGVTERNQVKWILFGTWPRWRRSATRCTWPWPNDSDSAAGRRPGRCSSPRCA